MKRLLVIFSLCLLTGNSIFAEQTLIRDTIQSRILNQTRTINLIKPDTTYGLQHNGKLNVVYVLDGSDLFLNLVAAQMAFHDPLFLVVGIESEETRMEDFFMPSNYYPKGRGDKFAAFMAEELFPYIESRYNVTQHRVGIGHSLGGSFLFYTLIERDTMFNACLIFSPNLAEGPLLDHFTQKYQKLSRFERWIYVSIGDIGKMELRFKNSMQKPDSIMAATPPKKGFKINLKYLQNVSHTESLPLNLGQAVKSYFDFSYATPDSASRVSLLAEKDVKLAIIKHYTALQSYLGYLYYPGIYDFCDDWIEFAVERKQLQKALEIADFAIDVHKKSTDHYALFLAKADVYQKLNDPKAALNACEEGRQSLESMHNRYSPVDYEWSVKEILDKIAEINSN